MSFGDLFRSTKLIMHACSRLSTCSMDNIFYNKDATVLLSYMLTSLAAYNQNMIIKLGAGNMKQIILESNKSQVPNIPRIKWAISNKLTRNGDFDSWCVCIPVYLTVYKFDIKE